MKLFLRRTLMRSDYSSAVKYSTANNHDLDSPKINLSLYSFKKLAGNNMVRLQMKSGVQDLLNEHKKIMNDVIKKHMPAL